MKVRNFFRIFFSLISVILVVGLIFVDNRTHELITEKTQITSANEKIARENQKKIAASKTDYDQKVTDVSNARYYEAKKKLNYAMQNLLIGQLQIKSVNLNLPIFAGMSDAALLNGVGTLSKDRMMGKGNYVLMSHNLAETNSSILLQPLKNVKIGDLVTITDFKHIYTYTVDFNQIVNEDRVDLIADTPSPTVTLFRCYGGAGTPYRMLVQGKLESVANYTADANQLKKQKSMVVTGLDKWVLTIAKAILLTGDLMKDWVQLLIAALPLILVLIGLIPPRKTKKKKAR